MELLAVNIGRPRPVPHRGKLIATGISKSPAAGPVMMKRTGLRGDEQADRVHHGGEHKAVYAYGHEMYGHWAAELKRGDLAFGQFGENLTVRGMPDDEVCIGDAYRIGVAAVEVTQPRTPCYKLGIRMGDASFVKRFLQSCRVGFYLRVLEEGEVEAGDKIELIARGRHGVSVTEACRLLHFDKQNTAAIGRVLEVDALSPAWREELEKLLQ